MNVQPVSIAERCDKIALFASVDFTSDRATKECSSQNILQCGRPDTPALSTVFHMTLQCPIPALTLLFTRLLNLGRQARSNEVVQL